MAANGEERRTKEMDFECAILLVAICGAGFLQLLRQVREDSLDFLKKSNNLS